MVVGWGVVKIAMDAIVQLLARYRSFEEEEKVVERRHGRIQGEGAHKKGQRKEIRRREVKQKDAWKSVQKNKRSGGEMLLQIFC